MEPVDIYSIFQAILETIEPGSRTLHPSHPPRNSIKLIQRCFTVSDEAVEKLSVLFSEQLLLAALDLIDRDCVVKYISPWGRSHFCVLGMTGSYTVFPSLHKSCLVPSFCTCPAFAYAVLISHSQITCKHVLATLIAQRLSKCVVREIGKEEFVSVLARQNPDI
ncbi:hypothetical protein BJV78DRAFT_1118074 [Lactifluus subvellereus]|nr:hypothetical protein BJV78DRAFT_1118074 [Lactifluus subvellereus]